MVYMIIYKYGIELFSTWDDAHSKWISKYFTNYKVSYLSINIRKRFKFGFATGNIWVIIIVYL